MPFSKMTFDIMALGIMTFNTFNISAISIATLDTQHNSKQHTVISVI
jgi:hypothetical protein